MFGFQLALLEFSIVHNRNAILDVENVSKQHININLPASFVFCTSVCDSIDSAEFFQLRTKAVKMSLYLETCGGCECSLCVCARFFPARRERSL
jgi:hypothetical protein